MKGNYRCAVDFETACPKPASACAIGIARIRDGCVTETFYSLIRPPEGMDILPFFTSIHGIRTDDVIDAPTFAEVWPRIRDFISGDTLLAHQASFDRGVLHAALAHYGLDAKIPNFDCTVELSRAAWPRLCNHRLDTMCEHLGIDLIHHEALSDAVACARIYLEAMKCLSS